MQTTVSPYTQEAYCSRTLHSPEDVSATIAKSREAYLSWKNTFIDDRIDICTRWLGILETSMPEVTEELALQMGR
jgi:acyl-CoA reductase-like NAD-dependent aldehyde dehydrogenase